MSDWLKVNDSVWVYVCVCACVRSCVRACVCVCVSVSVCVCVSEYGSSTIAPRQGVSSTFHVARKREHQDSGSYVSVTPSQDSTTRRLQTQAYSSGDFKTSSTCSTAVEPKRSSIASVSMRESGLHNSGSLPSLDGGCCLLRTKSKHDGKRPCGEPGHNQGLSSREDIKRRTDDSAKTGAGGDCSIPLMAVNQPEEDCVSRTAVQQSNQDCTTSLIVEKSKQDCVCPTSAQPPAEDCRTPLMAVNQPAHERSSDAAVRQPRHDCSCARVNVTRDRSRHAYTPNSKEAFHRRSSDAVKHPSNASSLANVTEPNPGSSTRSIVGLQPARPGPPAACAWAVPRAVHEPPPGGAGRPPLLPPPLHLLRLLLRPGLLLHLPAGLPAAQPLRPPHRLLRHVRHRHGQHPGPSADRRGLQRRPRGHPSPSSTPSTRWRPWPRCSCPSSRGPWWRRWCWRRCSASTRGPCGRPTALCCWSCWACGR